MARNPRRRPQPVKTGPAEVTVTLPPVTDLKIADLSKLSDDEIDELLDKAQKSKVRYIILNAPFKVRPLAPAS